MDETLLKSNFVGRDGFRWWIGQIPPVESQSGQLSGSGWGNRYKVRIMGYHPYSEADLPNEDLPWAQCIIPTTAGSGAANVATDVKLQQGDVVFGFFLDGDNGQLPVILGCFGRTSQVPSLDYQNPFQPFTGYTDNIKKPDKQTLVPNESNESNAKSQKSPRHVEPSKARVLGNDEVSYFSGIGDTLQLGSGSTATVVDKISCEVLNLLKGIQDGIGVFLNIDNEIRRIVRKIQGIVSGLVGNVINDLYNKLVPILNEGLKLLYQEVYNLTFAAQIAAGVPAPVAAAAAHAAGVAAQAALIPPVKLLEETIPAVINGVLNAIGDSVSNILISLVDNAERFTACAGIQFAAAVINDVISRIVSNLSSAIDGVSSILKFFSGFSVDDTIRNSITAISGIADSLGVNQIAPNYQAQIKQWIVGSGPKNVPPTPFAEILNNANVSQAIALVDGVLSAYSIFNSSTANPNSDCYTGPPINCSPATATIFGGNGTGATAIPLFGSIVEDALGRTGSIIGIKITNPGSGYDYPPFITIQDECGKGYGAVGSTIINNNGEVIGAYIISPGENYPVGEVPSYIIDKLIVQESGSGYSPNDKVIDNYGNEYSIQVSSNGNIINVLPLNNNNINSPTLNIVVKDIPEFRIESQTGSGAIIKAILDIRDTDLDANNIENNKNKFQGEVLQSIDCITP